MDIIHYQGTIPPQFFEIPQHIYSDETLKPEEKADEVQWLFEHRRGTDELYILTNKVDFRLVIIFPKNREDAYFAYFESKEDLELNKTAFAMAEALCKEHGRKQLIGPMHFNTFHRYRFRKGDVPSWQMFNSEPVNPAYYIDFMQQLGFEELYTYESRLVESKTVPDVYADKQYFMDSLDQIGMDYIPLTPNNWELYFDQLFQLIQDIFSQNTAYQAVDKDEFELLYGMDFVKKLCPHTSVVFKDKKNGRFTALALCHPNYNELKAKGFHHFEFETDYPKLKHRTMLCKTVGVHPEYRQRGLMSYLGAYGMLSFKQYYDDAIFCLMKSDNISLKFTDDVATEKAYYALYHKKL